jgi:hypothetical protein
MYTCSVERALANVGVCSLLNGSVHYSSEASACEQSRAFASAEQASVYTHYDILAPFQQYITRTGLTPPWSILDGKKYLK